MKPPVLDRDNLTEETYERYEHNDFMDIGHIDWCVYNVYHDEEVDCTEKNIMRMKKCCFMLWSCRKELFTFS